MKLPGTLALVRRPRTLRRVREILSVLLRYGFGDVVGRMGRLRVFAGLGRLLRWRREGRAAREALSTERRIRLVLQDLGPTFIKFGQILANRPDLVPVGLITELKELQDRVKPFSSDEARELLESELGRPLDEIFSEFEDRPIASASIAQVHRARLVDGTSVAVKIRRPGIGRTIDSDLAILRMMAEALRRNLPEMARFDPTGLVKEFARSLRRELDFRYELYHLERFRRNLADEERLVVPGTYQDVCTSAVLVMDFIDGVRITDREAILAAGIDVGELVHVGVELTLRAIFEHRFFHADPHPGNFFVLPDGRLCLLDFGIMGSIAEDRLEHLLTFLNGALTMDVDAVVESLVDMGVLKDDQGVPELKEEIGYLLGRYAGVSIRNLQILDLLDALFDLFFRFHVKPPADLLLVIKTMGILEGVVREVYPEFQPLEEIRAFVVPFYVERMLDPDLHARRAAAAAYTSLRALQRLPGRLDRVLGMLESGELQVRVPDDLQAEMGRQRLEIANRMAWVGLTATAGVMTFFHVGASPAMDVFGWLGTVATATLGTGTLVSMWRASRRTVKLESRSQRQA